MKLKEDLSLPNESTYNGVFIVGKNNRGKTLFLQQYSEEKEINHIKIRNLIDIKFLEKDFERAKKDGYKNENNWYNKSIENMNQISNFISNDIYFKYEPLITEDDLAKKSIFSEFKISENGNEYFELSSTGYMSLFLIASYINFYKEYLNKFEFCYFDEIDMYLDITNKQLLIQMLKKIIPEVKFVLATHSPFTIVKTKKYLIYNIETRELAYTDDIGNFDGILKKMIKEYDSKYILSENFEKLKELYFKVLTKNLDSKETSEIRVELATLNIESFTFKETILFNSIEKLLNMA
ncbi:MAG: hypothetical protein ACRCZ2_07455 [Fusobacteriaceae bacterium]